MALKAALSRAAGYIAPNPFETAEPRTCIECGAPLADWQTSRCQACIDRSVSGVVIANSARWFGEERPDGMTDAEWADYLQFWHDEMMTETRPLCTAAQAEAAGALSL